MSVARPPQRLPARDVAGAQGKTYLFIGFDQIHAYHDYGLIEALAPDPTRLDALTWITRYMLVCVIRRRHSPRMAAGRRGDDARMFFSWYGADFSTDPAVYAEGPPGDGHEFSTARSTPLPRISEFGILSVYRPTPLSLQPVITEIEIWRAASLMLRWYGEIAREEGIRRETELAAVGDDAGLQRGDE
jgi:hypothetical protein